MDGYFKKKDTWILVFIFSVLVFVFGLFVGFVAYPYSIRSRIAEQTPLINGTKAFDKWNNMPIPVQFKAYFFNVSNPDEMLSGEKPEVKEIGPYVFDKWLTRDGLVLNELNDTATFTQSVQYQFRPDLSGQLSDDDEVFILNVLLNVIAYKVGDISPFSSTLNSAFATMFHNVTFYSHNGMFIKAKVKDILYGVSVPINCDGFIAQTVCAVLKAYAMPSVIEDETGELFFSLFHYKLLPYDGPYTINTGINNVSRVGEIITFQSQEELGLWGGPSCNKLMGTDMTIFQPFLDSIQDLFVFNSDAQRVIKLSYEDQSTYEGVNTRRYTTDAANSLSSVLTNPDNYCYCPRTGSGLITLLPDACYLDGLADVSPFQIGPLAWSNPHFWAADDLFYIAINGLNRYEDVHKTTLDIEPFTGSILKQEFRVQINFPLLRFPKVSVLRNITEVMMPVMWFEEHFELTGPLLDELQNQLKIPIELVVIVFPLLAFGLGGAILSILLFIFSEDKSKKSWAKKE